MIYVKEYASGHIMFSSRSFTLLSLPFRSLTDSFVFVYDVKECSNFIHLRVAVPVPIIEETVFSPGFQVASGKNPPARRHKRSGFHP